jgi:hypothetical protein
VRGLQTVGPSGRRERSRWLHRGRRSTDRTAWRARRRQGRGSTQASVPLYERDLPGEPRDRPSEPDRSVRRHHHRIVARQRRGILYVPDAPTYRRRKTRIKGGGHISSDALFAMMRPLRVSAAVPPRRASGDCSVSRRGDPCSPAAPATRVDSHPDPNRPDRRRVFHSRSA